MDLQAGAHPASKPDFTHLLLTRFNVVTGFASEGKGIEEEWLKDRVRLFMTYCLPSIVNQRDAAFHWLIFCNAASPKWFKDHMHSLRHICTPIYIEGLATDHVVARKVEESGYVTTPYLISTRMDNDDALAVDQLAKIQKTFRRQEREFILFPLGMQLFRGNLYGLCWLDNPFFSLIEKVHPSGQFTTVLCVKHGDIYKVGKVRRIWSTPQWLEVVHGNNVSNSLRGWPKLRSRAHRNFSSLVKDSIQRDSLISRIRFSSRRIIRRLRLMFGMEIIQRGQSC